MKFNLKSAARVRPTKITGYHVVVVKIKDMQ